MEVWEIEGSGSSLKLLLVGDTHFITSHMIPPADPLPNFSFLSSVFLMDGIGMWLEVKAQWLLLMLYFCFCVWRGEWLYKEMKNFFDFFVFFPFFLFYNTLHDLLTTSAIFMELELELKLCFQKLHNHFLLFFYEIFWFLSYLLFFLLRGDCGGDEGDWCWCEGGGRYSCSCYILLPHNVWE